MVSIKYIGSTAMSSASLSDKLLDIAGREPDRLRTELFPADFSPVAIKPVLALVEPLRRLSESQQLRWRRRAVLLSECRFDFFPYDSTKLSDFKSHYQGFKLGTKLNDFTHGFV